jgi:hypothetical protein
MYRWLQDPLSQKNHHAFAEGFAGGVSIAPVDGERPELCRADEPGEEFAE